MVWCHLEYRIQSYFSKKYFINKGGSEMSDMFKVAKGNTSCSATQLFHGTHYHKMFLKQ